MSSKQTIVRVYLVYVLILAFAFAVLVKISFVQFFDGGELVEQADKQIYMHIGIMIEKLVIFRLTMTIN